ncbi:sulfatase-like hydrolase/transferase [Fulvivirgaceae bacterium BMA12]|uniref:Sulfatase-like hydrolase/transferase n=1 Tax=Agaribacillus aureus TaxID=3051825 RepID=A0ABT8LI05_9BACT|nr:sulfatase-like hydrolase/transferase [Fulvivirgaceae bacterium BMA12]
MKIILCAILSIACSLSVWSQNKKADLKPERPNVILIMCDDLGWGDVGFNGNKEIKTPNLDRLAAAGITLSRFYSAGPVCSPTRASCLTGRNPFRMGIPTANSGHMRPEEITLPELLKSKGYHTGHFGKWHLGTLTATIKDANRGKPRDYSNYAIPMANGYDEYFVTESKVPTYDPMIFPSSFKEELGESKRYGWAAIEDKSDTRKPEFFGTHYWVGPERPELTNLEGDDSRVIMDRVIPFMRRSVSSGHPFFSVVWFHTPHLPLVATKKYRDMYSAHSHKKQLLYASITMMDEQVGRLWDELEKMGQADNTMLWFCSDNGPERGTPGSAGPFRERKRSLYEGGLRVPAFVIWPDKVKSGQVINTPCVTSDYLPTITDFLGIIYPDSDRPIDGISLKDILISDQTERKRAIGFQAPKKMSWVTDQYKLISNDEGQTFELYDLINDKSETKDISAENKKLVAGMKKDLLAWVASCRRSEEGKDY